jgi:hypothetical protein
MPELASVPTRQARRSASPGPGPSTLQAQARRYGQAGFGWGSGLRMERTRKDDREMEMRGRRGAGGSNLEVRQDPGQPQQSPSSVSLGSETGASPTSPGVDSSMAISSTTRPLFFSGTSTSMPVPTPTTQPFTGTGTGITPVVSSSFSGTDGQATTAPTSTDPATLAFLLRLQLQFQLQLHPDELGLVDPYGYGRTPRFSHPGRLCARSGTTVGTGTEWVDCELDAGRG